jgi:hypothetical protein
MPKRLSNFIIKDNHVAIGGKKRLKLTTPPINAPKISRHGRAPTPKKRRTANNNKKSTHQFTANNTSA